MCLISTFYILFPECCRIKLVGKLELEIRLRSPNSPDRPAMYMDRFGGMADRIAPNVDTHARHQLVMQFRHLGFA